MRRLNILIWHIHGSYLNSLSRVPHNWFVPTKPEKPEGYGGRGPTFDLTDNVIEVPAPDVRDLDLDLVVYQTPRNLFEDHFEILNPRQQRLPKVYLEHNTPKPDAVHTKHPLLDFEDTFGSSGLQLVHVTHFNRLMWDNQDLPVTVIEHSVAINPSAHYDGSLERGITVVNGMEKRPRIAGFDIFCSVREELPIDSAGMGTEAYGGMGDVAYRDLHKTIAPYRFLFSPIRYTSLPLAVIEAMTMGMPVVALATTELPSVIRDGESGFVSCDVERLKADMRRLLNDRDEAKRMGEKAREVATKRLGIERFVRDWDSVLQRTASMQPAESTLEMGRLGLVAR